MVVYVGGGVSVWNERYAGDEYHFGTEPNAFLVSQIDMLKQGMSCLAVADGEGRNGVLLAQQGLDVLSVDSSYVALEKARKLAQQRSVTAKFELVDIASGTGVRTALIWWRRSSSSSRRQACARICLRTSSAASSRGGAVVAARLHVSSTGIRYRRAVAS